MKRIQNGFRIEFLWNLCGSIIDLQYIHNDSEICLKSNMRLTDSGEIVYNLLAIDRIDLFADKK